MNRTVRLYRINDLLNQRKVVPVDVFLDELAISHATFKRDLEYLRDRFHASIEWNRDAGSYRSSQKPSRRKFESPSLWLNAFEIYTLLMMQQLLGNLGSKFWTPHIDTLMTRLRVHPNSEQHPASAIEKRVRIQRIHARPYETEHFKPIASAVLQRRRIEIDHCSKYNDKQIRREILSQSLTCYRGNGHLTYKKLRGGD